MSNGLPESLPLTFCTKKQSAILWYLLVNRQFFDTAKNVIKPSWFQEPITGKLYGALLGFHEKFGRLPSKAEFLECDGLMTEEGAVRNAMRAAVESACNASQLYGLDVLRSEITEWLHSYIYSEGAQLSAKHFNAGKFSEAFTVMSERMKLIAETAFDIDGEFKFDDLEKNLEQSQLRVTSGCTFGLPMVDSALTPPGVAVNGGLFRGDITCLISPVNVGKSISMITVAVANIMKERRVLYLIHEGSAFDVQEKILQNMLGIDKNTLWEYRTTHEGRNVLHAVQGILQKYLTFYPYIHSAMTVEDVAPIINRKCETAVQEGRPYDLLCDDYPALLYSDYAKQTRMEDRARIEMVYQTFSQLASENNLHCLVAAQVNRDGSRANKKEDRLLTMEDISESWGVMMKMVNVISINRSPSDSARNRLTYLIAKSRSSATGTAVVAGTNFAQSTAHSEKLGSCKYYAGSSRIESEELDRYVADYWNKEIPLEIVKG